MTPSHLFGNRQSIVVKAGKVVQQVRLAGHRLHGDETRQRDGSGRRRLYSPDGRTLWPAQAIDVLHLTVNESGVVAFSSDGDPDRSRLCRGSTERRPVHGHSAQLVRRHFHSVHRSADSAKYGAASMKP